MVAQVGELAELLHLFKLKRDPVCESEERNLVAGVHSVYPLLRGSHFGVPAHNHPNHAVLPLHHHLSNPQENKRGARAAHHLGGCGDKRGGVM